MVAQGVKTELWHKLLANQSESIGAQIEWSKQVYLFLLCGFRVYLILPTNCNTFTANRAQTLVFRASITPFNMVSPNPRIESAISRKRPCSSHHI